MSCSATSKSFTEAQGSPIILTGILESSEARRVCPTELGACLLRNRAMNSAYALIQDESSHTSWAE